MNALLDTAAKFLQPSIYIGEWIEVMFQSVIMLVVAAGACWLWRRAAAATRHLIWFTGLSILPLLLCLALLPHSWQRPLWSVATGSPSGNEVYVEVNLGPSGSGRVATGSTDAMPEAMAATDAAESGRPFSARFSKSWLAALFLVWAGGVVWVGVSTAAGEAKLRRLTRKATIFKEASSLAEEACRTLGIRRSPAVLLSSENLMPLTWGWLRPQVLLPAEAAHWPAEKCRFILLHELAHVKRRDCLTQVIAQVACALFWVNPLVWLAAKRMRVERERACDDLVLEGGCKPSEYAAQLLEVARSFRHARFAAGIAMARSPRLQGRIAAIVDGSQRRRENPAAAWVIWGFMGILAGCVAGTSGRAEADPSSSADLKQQQTEALRKFAQAKLKQSEALAAKAGESISPEFREYFAAALKGDYREVTNRYEFFKRHNPQYVGGTNALERLHTAFWQPVLELCLAYDHLANCEPKYTRLYMDELVKSIPAGSIYFGGTDPGRGLPTAFLRSSIDGDPFFCLSQNPLADSSYLDYLRATYGGKIYTPTSEDSQKCFQEYLADVQQRLRENKLKPGEDVKTVDNRVSVAGQVAVMSINALLAKVIFDRNPEREFYIEESFPLEWMYPHLEPRGLIMKVNRQPKPQLTEAVLATDHEYWERVAAQMLGNSLTDSGSVSELAAFVNRVYVRKDLVGFNGDPLYLQNDYAKKIFSKLRSAIAGVYAWRLGPNAPAEFKPRNDVERARLVKETDFAFRQAFALCPYSPEAIFRYVTFLVQLNRIEDARLIAQTSLEVDPKNAQVKDLLNGLEKQKR